MYFATHPSTILLISTSCYTCILLWKNPIQELQSGGTKDSKLTPYPIHEESHVSPSDSDSSFPSPEGTLKKFYRQTYHEEDANSPDRYYKGRVSISLSTSTSCCCCCYWAVANSSRLFTLCLLAANVAFCFTRAAKASHGSSGGIGWLCKW